MNGLSSEMSAGLPAYDEYLALSIMNGLPATETNKVENGDKDADDAASDCSSQYCDDDRHKVDVICDDDDCIEPVCDSEEQFHSFVSVSATEKTFLTTLIARKLLQQSRFS